MVAADAGLMQIQLREGVVWRCARAVQQGTEGDTGRGESDVSARLWRREGLRKWKDAVCRMARHRETERADTREGFVL